MSATSQADDLMLADDRLFAIAATWQQAGHGLAIAFVIQTWGSSPRQIGSLMLIRDDARIEGSVSGGCVEGAVIDAGLELISTGGSKCLDFGVADATAWDVGLSCGGQISILVMAVGDAGFPLPLLGQVVESLAERRPVGICLPLKDGAAKPAATMPEQSHLDGDRFFFVQAPRPQVIIIGAVHISQHLSVMARQCGFNVIIIDPRQVFATTDRFPDQNLIHDWPDDALAKIVLDADSAMVALTHDPKIDDVALRIALGKPLFHIAALGSRRTHAARLTRLAEAGLDATKTARIKGPAGLDIAAQTPAEIAVSVLAELITAYRRRQGG
ncbi:MAG: XdhC family protein [Candidatus Puniceispirillum sp.]